MRRLGESLALLFVGATFGALFSHQILPVLFWIAAYCLFWMYYLLSPLVWIVGGQG